MKFCKILAALLALLMLVSLVACGGNPADTTKAPGTTNQPDNPDDPGLDVGIPDDLSFADRSDNTITFFTRNNDAGVSNPDLFSKEIIVSETTNDALYDAIYHRNVDVENKLGVKLKQISQPGSETNDTWVTWNEALATAKLTNSGDYDVAVGHTQCAAVLTLQNVYYDLYELSEENGGYIDLSKPWWNQNSVEQLNINGSLYMVGSSMLISEVLRSFCIIYNKDLFNEKFPEEHYIDLYDMVENNKWTVDRMIGYVSQVWDDTNANGAKDDGDVIGFQYGEWPTISTWIYALGLNPVERDAYGDIALSYHKDPDFISVFETVSKLYNTESDGVMGGKPWKETKFENNKVLFSVGYVEHGESLRSASTCNYGILPMPMFTEDQGYYRTNTVPHASLLAVCSTITEDRIPMISATLELMSAESYDKVLPAYYSKVLHGIYSKEEKDAQMYDKVLEGITFDFASSYFRFTGTALKNYYMLFDNAKTPNYQIATTIDSNQGAWEKALEELMTQFAGIE